MSDEITVIEAIGDDELVVVPAPEPDPIVIAPIEEEPFIVVVVETAPGGGGDMYVVVYDSNNDGKVDAADHADSADSVPWSGVQEKPDTYPPDDHEHDTRYEPKNSNIQEHISSTSNPHGVTAAQAGADPAGTAATAVGSHESENDHALLHSNANDPTADEKAALAGTGTPSETNKFVTNDDARLADARTPTSHQHDPGDVNADSTHRFVTDTQMATWNGKQDALGFTPATEDHDHDGVYEPANANIQNHIASTSNPHSVTKDLVGLGNCDNTSDTNKPVSTAQQTALDGKISHSLATAVNDFLVASGVGAFVKKTLTEVKTLLGLGSAAYTESSAYAPAANGVTNGDGHDHNGGDGAAITEAALSLSDNTTGDVSTSKHGFVPKAPEDITKVLTAGGWADASGGGHTIESEGTPLTQRTGLNFGPLFELTDDESGDATNVDFVATTSIDASNLTSLVKAIEIGVTGGYESACNQITFDNLNGNEDEGYVLECELVSGTTSDESISLFVNNDLTATNYYLQYVHGDGSTPTSGINNYAMLTSLYGASSANGRSSELVDISRIGSYFVARILSGRIKPGLNRATASIRTLHKSATITNITRLDIKVDSTNNAFGVGSKIKLYRKKIRPALIFTDYDLTNLVDEKVVESDRSSVTFPGLNSLEDGDYILDFKVVGVSAYGGIALFVNGDSALSNYNREYHQVIGSSNNVGSQTGTCADIFHTSQNGRTSGQANIKVINGKAYADSRYAVSTSSDVVEIDRAGLCHKSAITSITSLVLSAGGTYIGAGSEFRLYKSKSARQLVDASVIDLTGRTSDYSLKVGETAKVDYSSETSLPLNIATDVNQGEYELIIKGDVSLTPGSNADVILSPNNTTTITGAIKRNQTYNTSSLTCNEATSAYSGYEDGSNANAFRLGQCNIIHSVCTISTKTKAKSVLSDCVSTLASSSFARNSEHDIWHDSSTEWSSLGTITFPYAQSGTVIIKRIA